jgi:RecB family exonuclease
VDIDHTSHSAIEEYKKCPQRYYLNRVLKVEGTQWLAGPAGSAFHTMTEDYDNNEHVASYQEYLDANLEPGVLYTHSRGEDYDWWVHTGPSLFDHYRRWRDATGWEIEAVEEEFRIQPDGLQRPVVGFIDRRFRTASGTTIICDIKTGYRLPKDSAQLPIYYVAESVRRAAGTVGEGSAESSGDPTAEHGSPAGGEAGGLRVEDSPVAVNYYDARRGDSTGLVWPTWTEHDLVKHVRAAEHGILTDDWTAKPSTQNCRYCPVRQHCQYKKGK